MKTHIVKSVDIVVPVDQAFNLIADPQQLPRWTNAFVAVRRQHAVMRTPKGEVEVELAVHAMREQGTIDWQMTFPDGSIATAYSRLLPAGDHRTIFSFVLLRPQTALQDLEGDLEEQSQSLETELGRLKELLENGTKN